MTSKYQKFGLRADKNLTDLDDRQVALRNMLEGLTVDENLPYTPADLQVINGLRNTEVTADDLIQVGSDDTRITYTPIDNPGVNQDVQPLVRIVDRIENYRVITGNPNFTNGGDGPTAYLIPSTALGTNLSQTSTGADVFANPSDEDVLGPVEFWDNGAFAFGIKVWEEFKDTYGGAQWEGYTQLTRFVVETSGLYIIEHDPYDTGYEIVKSIYAEDRELSYDSIATNNEGNTTITLSEGQVKHASIGDYIIEGGNPISVVSIEDDTISFDGVLTSVSGGTVTLSFRMSSETPITSEEINLRSSYVGDMSKVRITVWWSDRGDGDRMPAKNFEFKDNDSERYPFTYFYKDYTRGVPPAQYTYQEFAEKKASPLAEYSGVSLETSDTLAIQYIPPVDVSTKVKVSSRDFVYDGIGKLIGNTSGIEVGDWIVTSSPRTCHQVLQLNSEELWVKVDYANGQSFDATVGVAIEDVVTVDVISHIGLIGLYQGTGTGSSTALSVIAGGKSLIELKADYLIASSTQSKFMRITNINGSTITTSDTYSTGETFASDELILVYASSGLKDMSSETQCVGVIGKEATAPSTSNTITVSDNQGLVTGMYVQFLTGTSASDRIDVSTQITNINGNVLTLSKNVIGNIAPGATIVFIEEAVYNSISGDKNREYCILPLNTAPPFAGTDDGLATTTTYPNIKFNGLQFAHLSLNNTTTNVNNDFNYSETLDISYNGTQYKMFIK